MMTNGDDLCKAQLNRLNSDGEHFEFEYHDGGLTKREYFAALAMQGFLACSNTGGSPKEIASYATAYADALIEELNK